MSARLLPFRDLRETKRLESLPDIKPDFKTAERAHIDAWRNSRIERDFLAQMASIPAPQVPPQPEPKK